MLNAAKTINFFISASLAKHWRAQLIGGVIPVGAQTAGRIMAQEAAGGKGAAGRECGRGPITVLLMVERNCGHATQTGLPQGKRTA